MHLLFLRLLFYCMYFESSWIQSLYQFSDLNALAGCIISLKCYHDRNPQVLAFPLEFSDLRLQFHYLLFILRLAKRLR